MYLAKNITLLKNNVAYVSMATKYPIIKIVICANYEDIGHKFLPDTYDHTLMLYKKIMTLKDQRSRSHQGYMGLARCCNIS